MAFPCVAEQLGDPTRPPLVSPVAEGSVQSQADFGPVLQSVTMSKHRKVATISGQEVAVGEKLGEATLIKISDGEVVLRNPDGELETLRMYPQVVKKVVVPKMLKAVKKAAGKNK